jgi:glycine/D-amino acid oxidase-like deaminating enzyme
MNVSSERSQSIWMATAPKLEAPRLQKDETADVVIIGGGIAGLSTAYELAATGLDVVVVDRGPIGRGMTARTSGHLTWATDDEFARLISIHGKDKARLFY